MAILRFLGFVTLLVLGITAVCIGAFAGFIALLIREPGTPELDELEQGL